MNRQKRFSELFCFREDIYSMANFEKLHVSKINDCADNQIFLKKGAFSYFLIITVRFVNTPQELFLTDCSFKICGKPSKFSESVRVVLSVSA